MTELQPGNSHRIKTAPLSKAGPVTEASERRSIEPTSHSAALLNHLERNGELPRACAHCKAEIVGGHWFCRLPGNEGPILLCCPFCADRYFDRSHPEGHGSDHELNAYEHRLHFLVNGELWA